MTQSFSKKIFRFSRIIMFAFIATMIIGGGGCKSKKKAGEASDAAAEKARIEQEAKERARAEEERRRKEEERLAKERAEREAPARKLETYFTAIANARNVTAANETISEALSLFSSPDTPVLIVISEENGKKDYDRPTNIREYLHYLKDQKKNFNKVGDYQVDSSGKITRLELIKQ